MTKLVKWILAVAGAVALAVLIAILVLAILGRSAASKVATKNDLKAVITAVEQQKQAITDLNVKVDGGFASFAKIMQRMADGVVKWSEETGKIGAKIDSLPTVDTLITTVEASEKRLKRSIWAAHRGPRVTYVTPPPAPLPCPPPLVVERPAPPTVDYLPILRGMEQSLGRIEQGNGRIEAGVNVLKARPAPPITYAPVPGAAKHPALVIVTRRK